jgi:hypothetical protein
MITVKEAVASATQYMLDIYGKPEGLLVEEIELDSPNRVWNITMGFWIKIPPRTDGGALGALMTSGTLSKRNYKELKVSIDNGSVKSMKIRVLPDPN